jgi:hypothetical protein
MGRQCWAEHVSRARLGPRVPSGPMYMQDPEGQSAICCITGASTSSEFLYDTGILPDGIETIS